jgi:ABC-2 type transporter
MCARGDEVQLVAVIAVTATRQNKRQHRHARGTQQASARNRCDHTPSLRPERERRPGCHRATL